MLKTRLSYIDMMSDIVSFMALTMCQSLYQLGIRYTVYSILVYCVGNMGMRVCKLYGYNVLYIKSYVGNTSILRAVMPLNFLRFPKIFFPKKPSFPKLLANGENSTKRHNFLSKHLLTGGRGGYRRTIFSPQTTDDLQILRQESISRSPICSYN